MSSSVFLFSILSFVICLSTPAFAKNEIGISSNDRKSYNKALKLALANKNIDMNLFNKIIKDANKAIISGVDGINPTLLCNDITFGGMIYVFGHISGDIKAFKSIAKIVESNANKDAKFVFLGNYTKKNDANLSVITGLLSLKCLYPDKIYILKGTQERGTDILHTMNYSIDGKKLSRPENDIFSKKSRELARKIYRIIPHCIILDKAIFTHGGAPMDEYDNIYTAKVPNYTAKPSFIWGRSLFNSETGRTTSPINELYYTEEELNNWCVQNNIKALFRTSDKNTEAFVDDFPDSKYCGHYTLNSTGGGKYISLMMDSYNGERDTLSIEDI